MRENIVATVGAEASLSSLLERVEAGEEIVITRSGKPVARLVSVDRAASGATDGRVEELTSFRRGRRLGEGLSIRMLIEEGRR